MLCVFQLSVLIVKSGHSLEDYFVSWGLQAYIEHTKFPHVLLTHPALQHRRWSVLHATLQGELQCINTHTQTRCCAVDTWAPGGDTQTLIFQIHCSFPHDQGFCEHPHVMLSQVCVFAVKREALVCIIRVWPFVLRPCCICSVCSLNTTAHVYRQSVSNFLLGFALWFLMSLLWFIQIY